MKRNIFLSLILLHVVLAGNAQQATGMSTSYAETYRQRSFGEKFGIELSATATAGSSANTVMFNTGLRYEFVPRLYALAHYGTGWRLHDDTETYRNASEVGAGLGFKLTPLSSNSQLDLRTSFATSIDGTWKHNTFGAGLWMQLGSPKSYKLTLGLGYQHQHSRTTGVNHFNGISATIGISF